MLEKFLITLATSLIEKLGKWLFKKWEEGRANAREHERIGNAVETLIEARSKDDIRTAFDNLP